MGGGASKKKLTRSYSDGTKKRKSNMKRIGTSQFKANPLAGMDAEVITSHKMSPMSTQSRDGTIFSMNIVDLGRVAESKGSMEDLSSTSRSISTRPPSLSQQGGKQLINVRPGSQGSERGKLVDGKDVAKGAPVDEKAPKSPPSLRLNTNLLQDTPTVLLAEEKKSSLDQSAHSSSFKVPLEEDQIVEEIDDKPPPVPERGDSFELISPRVLPSCVLPSPLEKHIQSLEAGKGWKNAVLEDGTAFIEMNTGRRSQGRYKSSGPIVGGMSMEAGSRASSVPSTPVSARNISDIVDCDTPVTNPVEQPRTPKDAYIQQYRKTESMESEERKNDCDFSVHFSPESTRGSSSGRDVFRIVSEYVGNFNYQSDESKSDNYSVASTITTNRGEWDNADRAKILLHNMQLEREVAFLQAKLEKLTKEQDTNLDSKDDDNYSLAGGVESDSADFDELDGLSVMTEQRRTSNLGPFQFVEQLPDNGLNLYSQQPSGISTHQGHDPNSHELHSSMPSHQKQRSVSESYHNKVAQRNSMENSVPMPYGLGFDPLESPIHNSMHSDADVPSCEMRDKYSVRGINLNPQLHAQDSRLRPNSKKLRDLRRGGLVQQTNLSQHGVKDGRRRLNHIDTKPSPAKSGSQTGSGKKKRSTRHRQGQTDHRDGKTATPNRSPIQNKVSSSGAASKLESFSTTLSVRWAEVEFTLRKPITNDNDLNYVMAAAEAGQLFLDQLEDKASDLGLLKGTLSRMILPYDAETSVADQASVSRASLPEKYQDQFTQKEIQFLVTGAMSLRKLIRVKMADDADLDQARLALDNICSFFRRLQTLAKERGVTPYAVIQDSDDSFNGSTETIDTSAQSQKVQAAAQGNTKLLKKKIQRKQKRISV